MGLSTKQVISDDHDQLDWSQTLLQSDPMEFPKPRRQQIHQQPQQPPLKCPRCDSANTKFCYYNNYNKLQPRHFCKACKRHWTKGGTLRNVPVGGGRKNKRVKRSNSTSAAAAAAAAATANRRKKHTGIKIQPQSENFPLVFDDQKVISDPLYHSLLHDYSVGNNGTFFPVPPNQTLDFSFSSFSSFESSTRKLEEAMEDPPIIATTIMPNSSGIVCDQPWELVPSTSSVMEVPNDWNWNDLETMVSADLNVPWDDTLIEP